MRNSFRTEHSQPSRRVDGVRFDAATNDEYLGVLLAKHLTGVSDDDKGECDNFVLAKILARMLLTLERRAHDTPEVTSKIRFSGVQERAYRWCVLTATTQTSTRTSHIQSLYKLPRDEKETLFCLPMTLKVVSPTAGTDKADR